MKRIIHLIVALGLLLHVGCGTGMDAPGQGSTDSATLGQSTAALATPAPAATRQPDAPPHISAWRAPNKDWREYAKNWTPAASTRALAALSVYDSRVAPASANFSSVPAWSDADIKSQFRGNRDIRFLFASTDPNFIRRSSWLYPDDGCFARAELVADLAGDNGKPKPYKLFSFGNLQVSTNNHPSGHVTWAWHVVPVVKSASSGTIYVLDPAIEPTHPLEWHDWLLRQVTSLSLVQVTVADPNAYNPGSPVTGGTNQRTTAISDLQGAYLLAEWDRQLDLFRDPTLVLGDYPPWGPPNLYFISGGSPALMMSACVTCLGADALSPRCALDCP